MSVKAAGLDLITDLRVVELGPGLAGAVCGQSFVEARAHVVRETGVTESDNTWLAVNDGKERAAKSVDTEQRVDAADLVIVDVTPAGASAAHVLIDGVRSRNPDALIVSITPFGLSGPNAEFTGGDLVSFHASGMGRLLIGQVEDPESEPPVRAAGDQSAFVAGVTAACAAMLALARYSDGGPHRGGLIDVSTQEALACMAIRELAAPASGNPSQARRREGDGNGSTVSIIPASDGFVAISPREERQWRAWLGVMGSPDWGREGRFASKADRAKNWGDLHPLISEWSATHPKQWIYETAQDAHVPSFPLATPGDLLSSPQLLHRKFFREFQHPTAGPILRPGAPYRVRPMSHTTPERTHSPTPRTMAPIGGVRVLDLSWVIAGPTCTRYLAALGADVIKVETASRADPGRASELHAVLGKSKRGITLDLKRPEALEIAHRLVERCDVVVENFATGVLDRLGLGYESLSQTRPDIVLLSASGLGRTGPEAGRVAYGTLIQCYTGFASLNGYPDTPPRVGWAWADPLCGLRMAFAIGAALRRRARTGEGGHIDFSMVESLLTTMPGPLIEHQLGGSPTGPMGNDHPDMSPHGVYPCIGDDEWVAISTATDDEWTALCTVVPGLKGRATQRLEARRRDATEISAVIADWTSSRSARDAAVALQRAGVSAAPSPDSTELFGDPHLQERGFYRRSRDMDGSNRGLPGLPWRWPEGERSDPTPAPELGADTGAVLKEILGMTDEEIAALRDSGALE